MTGSTEVSFVAAGSEGGGAALDQVIGLSIFAMVVTAVLLWVTVSLVLRLAPDEQRPPGRVTFGSTLVIVAWLVSSAVFGWYLRSVADYGSVFGNLAVVMVTLGFIYLASIVFLTGLQLDSLIRGQVEPLRRSPEHELGGGANGRCVAGDQQHRDDRVAPRV